MRKKFNALASSKLYRKPRWNEASQQVEENELTMIILVSAIEESKAR